MATKTADALMQYNTKKLLLCSGYGRLAEKDLNNVIIPASILKLCSTYLINLDVYFTINGITCIENKLEGNQLIQTIRVTDTTFKFNSFGERGAICYSEYQMDRIKKHLYEWKLKCVGRSAHDMIGIVSTLNGINQMQMICDTEGDSYCWWSSSGIWRRGNGYSYNIDSEDCVFSKRWNIESTNGWSVWNVDDVIKMELNTKNWTLTYFKNDKKVFDVVQLYDVHNECVWYPFVALGSKQSKYIHTLT
eukprot:406344_1